MINVNQVGNRSLSCHGQHTKREVLVKVIVNFFPDACTTPQHQILSHRLRRGVPNGRV